MMMAEGSLMGSIQEIKKVIEKDVLAAVNRSRQLARYGRDFEASDVHKVSNSGGVFWCSCSMWPRSRETLYISSSSKICCASIGSTSSSTCSDEKAIMFFLISLGIDGVCDGGDYR